MAKADALLERIEAFPFEGGVVVRKMARGYSLFSARTGAAIVRRPGARMAPATRTSACCQVGPVKPAMNGRIQAARISG